MMIESDWVSPQVDAHNRFAWKAKTVIEHTLHMPKRLVHIVNVLMFFHYGHNLLLSLVTIVTIVTIAVFVVIITITISNTTITSYSRCYHSQD